MSYLSTCMTFTALATYGKYEHVLTVNELAAHHHTGIKVNNTHIGWKSGILAQGSLAAIRTDPEIDVTTYDSGKSQPHNNIQPSIGVFFWKRIE